MKIKPILFNTEMVQAIMSGRKTQTRRVIKSKTGFFQINKTPDGIPYEVEEVDADGFSEDNKIKPKYQIGDIMWGRETWVYRHKHDKYYYRADNKMRGGEPYAHQGWRPSIFMPKDACRLFMKVVDVRIERLQDISEEDAIAEGVKETYPLTGHYKCYTDPNLVALSAVYSFETLWQSINGKKEDYTWDDNPWLWVYEFERTDKPENFL